MIDDILARLEKVRRTGSDNWIACCPSHADKSPSLTVKECSDGRILAKCFAGCSIEQIVDAVGMGWDAWFPPKVAEYAAPVRRPYPAAAVLEAVQFECLVVATAACNVAQGVEMTDLDRERLLLSYDRISEARRLALG